jgi:phosphoribosylformylglycinamidine cyclo-ligase
VSNALRALLAPVHPIVPASHGRPVGLAGHYAGLVRLGRETIAITTDTVGTKVLLAAQLGRWEEVGEDIVGVNVNDLAAVGARPAGLVDTIVCARPDTARFRAIGRGIHRGLNQAGCPLLGGETAVASDIVRDIDLGGTAIGFFPPGRTPVTGHAIRPGDSILGIPSSGFHANGFTLVRRVLEEGRVDPRRPRPGGEVPLGVELLRPTRIYCDLADDLADRPGIHGFAHMSGGGVRNLVRLHPGVEFVLDDWPEPPPLFQWMAGAGGISEQEMFQTFNMGIGFVVVVASPQVGPVLRRLASIGGRDARVIGRIGQGRGVSLPQRNLRYSGYS